MRAALLALLALLAISACSAAEPVSQPPEAVPPPPSAAPPTSSAAEATVATLPPAPPPETWVIKGDNFQETLDLNLQTELIELGVSSTEADEDAARDLAYLVCTALRAEAQLDDVWALIRAAYPTATEIDAIGIESRARYYCLDTV